MMVVLSPRETFFLRLWDDQELSFEELHLKARSQVASEMCFVDYCALLIDI